MADKIDPVVNCMQCNGELFAGDVLYDEMQNHYFCDYQCFSEWADMNFESVIEYYYRHNIM